MPFQERSLAAIGHVPQVGLAVGRAAGQQAPIRSEGQARVTLDAARDDQLFRACRDIPQADAAAAHVDRQQAPIRAVRHRAAGTGVFHFTGHGHAGDIPELDAAAGVNRQRGAVRGEGDARHGFGGGDKRRLFFRAQITRRVQPHANRAAHSHRPTIRRKRGKIGGTAPQAHQLHHLRAVTRIDLLPVALGQ